MRLPEERFRPRLPLRAAAAAAAVSPHVLHRGEPLPEAARKSGRRGEEAHQGDDKQFARGRLVTVHRVARLLLYQPMLVHSTKEKLFLTKLLFKLHAHCYDAKVQGWFALLPGFLSLSLPSFPPMGFGCVA